MLETMSRTLRLLLPLVAFSLLFSASSVRAYHFPWDQNHDTTTPEENEDPPETCEGDTCNECDLGSPVYVATGHLLWSETDVSLNGRPNLSVSRAYNSHDPRDGLFGNGWSTNCEISIYKTTSIDEETGAEQEQYVILLPNGKRHIYEVGSDGTVMSPDGRYDTLEPQDEGTVKLTALNGSYRIFDRAGHVLQKTDRNGNSVIYEYDDADRLVTMRDENGRSLAFAYNAAGRVSAISDHGGRQWYYDYDGEGNLVSITDPEGGLRQFDYEQYTNSADGQIYQHLVRITDASGVVVIEVQYNGSRVASYTEGENRYNYTHDTAQKRAIKVDKTGLTWTYTYNDRQEKTGVAVSNVNGGSDSTEYTHDPNGNRTLIVDPAGKEWSYDYDELGRLLSQTNPLGETTKYSYLDQEPWPVSVTSPSGRITAMTYDDRGNLLMTTDPLGDAVTVTWNDKGDLTSITDALGRSTNFTYNAIGLLTSVTDPELRTTTYEYDDLGRRIREIKPGGQTRSWVYDNLDRIVTAKNGVGNTSQFTYDAAGRVESVKDWAGASTQFEYDGYGRKVKELRPDGSVVQYTYNIANQLSSKTNPDSSVINYRYDAKQRLEETSFPGESYTYSYSPRDLLTGVSQSSNGWQIDYVYDDATRLVSETHNGHVIAIERNKEGEVVRRTIAGEVQSLIRNLRGQVTNLEMPSAVYSFSYDSAGQMVSMDYPGGNSSTSFNAAGQYVGQQVGDNLGTQFNYSYDSNGRLSQLQGEGADWGYSYDSSDRLTSATHGAENYSYVYDPNGNRLEDGQKYDSFNKLLSSQSADYSHDANGNRIRKVDTDLGEVTSYSYDALNRLTSAKFYPEGADSPSWSANYQYDAFNRRIGKQVTGTLTEDNEYLWSGGRLLAEYTRGTNTPERRYHYIESSFAPVAYSEAGNTYTVHSDYLDTPKVLTDSSGNVVWSSQLSPYGRTNEKTDPDGDGRTVIFNVRFPGQYHDYETGLNYNWNRTYDPERGQYLQTDPIGLKGGSNTFSYANQNPIRFYDADGRTAAAAGLCFIPGVGWVGCGAAAAGAAGAGAVCYLTGACQNFAEACRDLWEGISGSWSAESRPPGTWPADSGAAEWGKRNGVGAREGKNRFHDSKQGSPWPGGAEDWSVDPESGEIYDPNGDSYDNLNDL